MKALATCICLSVNASQPKKSFCNHFNMSQPFFIAGLPRSGTAWLSAILTAHGMPCLHEGVKFVQESETYLDMLERTLNHGFVNFFGDAGSHIQFAYKEILESYPLANFVIINRSINASKISTIEHLAKIKFPDDEFGKQILDGIDKCASALADMEMATPCSVFGFEYMFTSRGMNQIIRHLSGGEVRLNETIFRIFSRVNIQATNDSHNESYLAIKRQIPARF